MSSLMKMVHTFLIQKKIYLSWFDVEFGVFEVNATILEPNFDLYIDHNKNAHMIFFLYV